METDIFFKVPNEWTEFAKKRVSVLEHEVLVKHISNAAKVKIEKMTESLYLTSDTETIFIFEKKI